MLLHINLTTNPLQIACRNNQTMPAASCSSSLSLLMTRCCRSEQPELGMSGLPKQRPLICNSLTNRPQSTLFLAHCSPLHALNSAGTTRRTLGVSMLSIGLTMSSGAAARPAKAEEGDGGGVVGAIKALFDPNERTKGGKVLPRAYLKAARDVVKTLRESLAEDGGDVAKFRRSADAAKESIREYLGGWRGREAVAAEESYAALERAIRSLAEFYSKSGPFASIPEEVKSKILDDLNTADAFL